ncbi:MAG TPA: HlyD family efflux transporter periplasmic adaptor subunit [Gammaproteobacteria bacterium]|nr:HlyD family efflux transporter periplasmic adaptor subunit [Gammaproteobacteria bacterium]
MVDPQVMLQRHGTPVLPPMAIIVMVLLTLFGFWAHHTELDQIVIAMGKVAPRGEVKVIQHLEGGIIETFHVEEGDHVGINDPLVTLDLAGRGINEQELQVRLNHRLLARVRLEAEASGHVLRFPEGLVELRPTQVAAEKSAYAARATELKSALSVLDRQKEQRIRKLSELKATRSSLEKSLDRRRLAKARLEGEALGKQPVFPKAIAARRPALLKSELAAFDAHQKELKSALLVLDQQKEQRVRKLLELKATRSSLEKSLDRRRLAKARLEGEALGKQPVFPKAIMARRPALLKSELAAFEAHQKELKSALIVLKRQQGQRLSKIEELKASRDSVTRSLAFDRKELVVQEKLYKEQLSSQLELIAARQKVEDKRGQLQVIKRAILTQQAEHKELAARRDETVARFRRQARDQAAANEGEILAEHLGQLEVVKRTMDTMRAEFDEFDARFDETIARFRSQARDQAANNEGEILAEHLGQLEVVKRTIDTVRAESDEFDARFDETIARFRRRARDESTANEAEISALTERLNVASAQQGRAVIRSPIEGEVKNFRYHTVGGVVGAGEAILEIVPLLEQLVIDSKSAPADRGLIRAGLAAEVKLTAYDFLRYGSLYGEISHVASDTSFDEAMGPYYRVVVTTEQGYIGDDATQHQITPGMDAIVEIKVGTQTVLQALIRPVARVWSEAMREPG